MTPADLIRRARHSAGLTQAALGAAVGRTSNTIARYEAGRQDPPASVLVRVLEVCGGAVVFRDEWVQG